LKVELDPFQIGDLVRYTYYEWAAGPRIAGAERSNIGFVVDIINDPDEKQVDMFPKVLIYDTALMKTILAHSYNVEFISRGS
jgi:hypothetical protein